MEVGERINQPVGEVSGQNGLHLSGNFMKRAGGAVLALLAVGVIAPTQFSEAPDKLPTPKEVEIKSGGEDDCSTFRHMKNGRFFGIACASRGDRSIPVGYNQEYKRWVYAHLY
ncbi:hypothetical protein KY385_03645 [Candidatus Parcubacteria bacterium]|nr:hypothetical protein [Candidatus Parcubacteria bacterium]